MWLSWLTSLSQQAGHSLFEELHLSLQTCPHSYTETTAHPQTGFRLHTCTRTPIIRVQCYVTGGFTGCVCYTVCVCVNVRTQSFCQGLHRPVHKELAEVVFPDRVPTTAGLQLRIIYQFRSFFHESIND